MKPLVTVIALCYKHKPFLREALESVLAQTYSPVELIVVDDAGHDGSAEIIEGFISDNPQVRFIRHEVNHGNCYSFNEALTVAKGKYIIDFATDDKMLPIMVEKMVEAFESLSEEYGIVFSNSGNISEQGDFMGYHFNADSEIPEGDVYNEVVRRYFISPPATMMRRDMLEELGGYDTSLAYEDFDLWVRAARNYKFQYLDEVTILKRIHPASLSHRFYDRNEKLQASTFRICQKIKWLNKSEEENLALYQRCRYEMRVACLTGNFLLFFRYVDLIGKRNIGLLNYFLLIPAMLRVNMIGIYRLWLKGIKQL